VRKYIGRRLMDASVSKIEIQRTSKLITLEINTARPGIVIGSKGKEVNKLREEIKKLTQLDVQVNVVEIKRPELDAYIVGENIANQLKKKYHLEEL